MLGDLATALERLVTDVLAGEVAVHGIDAAGRFGLWTSSDRWLRQLLVVGGAIAVALTWQPWLAGRGINVPLFLACLLTAAVFTNAVDLLKRGVDLETADVVGTVALRLFLAMSLMSLDLGAVARAGATGRARGGGARLRRGASARQRA